MHQSELYIIKLSSATPIPLSHGRAPRAQLCAAAMAVVEEASPRGLAIMTTWSRARAARARAVCERAAQGAGRSEREYAKLARLVPGLLAPSTAGAKGVARAAAKESGGAASEASEAPNKAEGS